MIEALVSVTRGVRVRTSAETVSVYRGPWEWASSTPSTQ